MYRGHRVVIVTPAGRRRYLEVLASYVRAAIAEDLVDDWQLWVNTTADSDLAYLRQLGEECTGDWHAARLLRAGDPRLGIGNIRNFYPHACQPHTLYVRLDDDIVYLHPDCLRELLYCRLEWEEAPIVSAAVINNVLCDWLRQRTGTLAHRQRLAYACMCTTGWGSGLWAEHVHRAFLEARDSVPPQLGAWQTQDWSLLDAERFSINAIAWRGEEMAAIVAASGVGNDEESWLTEVYPRKVRRVNRICGSAIAVHFAFAPQRAYLETTDLLARYRELSEELVAA